MTYSIKKCASIRRPGKREDNITMRETEPGPPPHVISEWLKQCTCCPVCQQKPCDGVMAGGMCDDLCDCDEYEDNPELIQE